jgi:DNA-binding response OmpR family regulator
MTKNKQAKILLIEDDPNLSEVLRDYLELQGYEIDRSFDGEDGLNTFYRSNYDLCLVDVMMPKKDGFSLAEDIRKVNKEIPIIFITAKSFKDDRIQGFKIGCDDYICKPFSTEELSLRIQAVLKRCQSRELQTNILSQELFHLGSYSFDYANMSLKSPEQQRMLTRKEADLLRLLVINKNNLLKRETALKVVWGDDDYFNGRSMDVFLTKLRKYLADDPKITITNVHGTGFKLEIQE